jgi:molybdopterin-synthase adenylyltransferase
MASERFARQIALFGEEGQHLIRASRCAIVGVGGLGTHLVQQLALLGVGGLNLIDDEELAETNRNRYVGVRHSDPVPGFRKVDLGERIAHDITPSIEVNKVFDSFISLAGYEAIRSADYVFGCLDLEGARLILNELCSAYARPYFDLASDVIPGDRVEYGGRVCVALGGDGCIQCLGVLDASEAGRDLAGEAEQRNRDAIYGVHRDVLGGSGPSVVSINGVIASLAVTEFMVTVTKLRPPQRVLTYRGSMGKVLAGMQPPSADCFYCKGMRGTAEGADVERYIRSGMAARLRGRGAQGNA